MGSYVYEPQETMGVLLSAKVVRELNVRAVVHGMRKARPPGGWTVN